MKKKILGLFILAFLINLFWEVAHTPLYHTPTTFPIAQYILILLRASLGDALFIFAIFGIISLTHKSLKWIEQPSRKDYLIIFALGIIIAIVIEVHALSTGRWAYNELMPTILGIGLTPLVQLSVTAIAALWLLHIVRNAHV